MFTTVSLDELHVGGKEQSVAARSLTPLDEVIREVLSILSGRLVTSIALPTVKTGRTV